MNLETDLGFDLYGRYAIMRDIINETRLKQHKFKILDVGGRGNLLKLFLPNDNVFYLDPNIDSEDANFIKADGCDLPFENDSFDWIVSADVLEHIPENNRNIFIDEQYRVCKYGFIVAAPFHSQIVVDAEISINNRFNELFGTDHPWLIEHIQNGLPDISFLTEYARKNKIKVDVFHNNEIHLWELSYNLIFLKDLNPVIDLSNFTEYYNKNYKTELAQKDSYRKILVFQKQYKHEFYKNEINADFSVFMQNIIRIVNDEQTNSFKNNSLTISNLNNQIQNFNQRKKFLFSIIL
jgi:O-antigen biosynthesis protein